MTKTCTRCRATLDVSAFGRYRSRGNIVRSVCRSCEVATKREWREANPDRAKEHRKRWIEAHPEKAREGKMRWKRENPEARRAHKNVGDAVRKGTLVRPDACEKCSELGTVQAHHRDYSRPLEVVWLCQSCHQMVHAKGEE